MRFASNGNYTPSFKRKLYTKHYVHSGVKTWSNLSTCRKYSGKKRITLQILFYKTLLVIRHQDRSGITDLWWSTNLVAMNSSTHIVNISIISRKCNLWINFDFQLTSDIRLDPRPEYYRCVLSWKQSEDGLPLAEGTGSQISSRLLSMRAANAMLALPPKSENQSVLPAGSVVDAIVIGRL